MRECVHPRTRICTHAMCHVYTLWLQRSQELQHLLQQDVSPCPVVGGTRVSTLPCRQLCFLTSCKLPYEAHGLQPDLPPLHRTSYVHLLDRSAPYATTLFLSQAAARVLANPAKAQQLQSVAAQETQLQLQASAPMVGQRMRQQHLATEAQPPSPTNILQHCCRQRHSLSLSH